MRRGRLVTIGSFDGVHRGHQALLDRAILEARKRKLKSLALTFTLPPRMVLDPKTQPKILSDAAEKKSLLCAHGIDEVVILNFDEKVAALKPFSFFRSVLLRELKAKGLVIGSDFRFGRGRSAGVLELVRWGEEFAIPVWVIPPVRHQGQVVSSSFIRHLLETGHFKKAIGFLGHPYVIQGRVVPGRGAGRGLGFPTANLEVNGEKILPRGVFVVQGHVVNAHRPVFNGVCNIGVRPTFLKKSAVTVEIHALGGVYDFRGQMLQIELLHLLRAEKKFRSSEQLRRTITNDIRRAKDFWG